MTYGCDEPFYICDECPCNSGETAYIYNMQYGPFTLTRADGSVLVFVPTDNPFVFGIYMVGNLSYNIAERLANAECTGKVAK